jgi:protein CpxP
MFVSIAALVAGIVVFAAAQSPGRQQGGPPPPPPPPNLDRMARDLNLTDAQKAQIKTILDAERAAMEASRPKFEDLRKQIEAATANGQFDEATVRGLANQQAQLMADQMVEHERAKSQIYNVLTPDQRTKAQTLHQRQGPGGFGRPGPPPPPPPPEPEN